MCGKLVPINDGNARFNAYRRRVETAAQELVRALLDM